MSDNIETLALPDDNHAILGYKSEPEIVFENRVKAEDRDAAQKFEKDRDSTQSFSEYPEVKERILKEPIKADKEHQYSEHSNFKVADVLESKKESVENALEIIREKFSAQTAAVFLINKDDFLERFSLVGYDLEGHKIHSHWYEQESYDISDDSFVGSAAVSQEGSTFGEIRYTEDLSNEVKVDLEGKRRYTQKCGYLKSAIVVPLHGRRKIYGVLRIINKVEVDTKRLNDNAIFNKNDDVVWLHLLANSVASILSDFAWSSQAKILGYFHSALSDPPEAIEDYYQKSVDLLVKNPETRFKAAVLRVLDPKTQCLRVVSISLSNDLTGQRKNPAVKIGDGLAGWVAKEKRRLILTKLRFRDELVNFRDKVWINKDWIIRNNLQAFGCFPLIAEGRVVGTLSFYTKCEHDFDADINEFTFLKSVTELIASFTLFRVIRDSQSLGLADLFARTSSKFEDHTVRNILSSNHQELVETVRNALRNDRYDFRTASGIAGETDVDKAVVSRILEEGTFSRKSLLTSKHGESLYTDHKRKVSLQEFLALSQRILSMPFYSRSHK